MPKTKVGFKNDKFKKTRGGYSRLLDISCADCKTHICFYQKDGPGILKRVYLDRIIESVFEGQESKSLKAARSFVCPNCKQQLGTPIVYKKENRLAYRLFVGSVLKKISKSNFILLSETSKTTYS